MWWPLTLNYIFKVSRPWLKKSCPLCSVYSSGWIHFRCGTNYYYHYRVCRVIPFFSEYANLNFWQFLKNFRPWPWKKSTVVDGFFPYWYKWSLAWEGVLHVMTFDLDSSRSFDLDFENRVRSVTFSVLDRLFPYLPQIITAIRGCVTY